MQRGRSAFLCPLHYQICWTTYTFVETFFDNTGKLPTMSSENIFNKLWVIESLPYGELETGKNLVDNQLEEAKKAHSSLQVSFEQPATKAELIAVLMKIKQEAKNGVYPMIHFECHGCKDGLGAANRELIGWEEIRDIFIDINRCCGLNLMIVVAACNGVHLIKVSTQLDAAPFWAVIGPEKKVMAGDIQDDFGEFYKIFFEYLDGDKALEALNRGKSGHQRIYHFHTAEGLFLKAYRKYFKNHCTDEGREKRIESLISQAMEDPKVRQRGADWVRAQVEKSFSKENEHFECKKQQFFFMDEYPENRSRFNISMKDVTDPELP